MTIYYRSRGSDVYILRVITTLKVGNHGFYFINSDVEPCRTSLLTISLLATPSPEGSTAGTQSQNYRFMQCSVSGSLPGVSQRLLVSPRILERVSFNIHDFELGHLCLRELVASQTTFLYSCSGNPCPPLFFFFPYDRSARKRE